MPWPESQPSHEDLLSSPSSPKLIITLQPPHYAIGKHWPCALWNEQLHLWPLELLYPTGLPALPLLPIPVAGGSCQDFWLLCFAVAYYWLHLLPTQVRLLNHCQPSPLAPSTACCHHLPQLPAPTGLLHAPPTPCSSEAPLPICPCNRHSTHRETSNSTSCLYWACNVTYNPPLRAYTQAILFKQNLPPTIRGRTEANSFHQFMGSTPTGCQARAPTPPHAAPHPFLQAPHSSHPPTPVL